MREHSHFDGLCFKLCDFCYKKLDVTSVELGLEIKVILVCGKRKVTKVNLCCQFGCRDSEFKSRSIHCKDCVCVNREERILIGLLASVMLIGSISFGASAATKTHTVVRGDILWKIAVRYEVGVSEIIAANPQIKNPDLIYPGQKVYVPLLDSTVTSYEQQVTHLVNKIRAENGLKALKHNWELSRVARYKSQDMKDNNYFSHTSPTYGSPFNMMKSFGISYRTAGENIAKGYRTPEAVVNGWMNSSGHRANILNASYTEIGVGYVADCNYWTQMFIG